MQAIATFALYGWGFVTLVLFFVLTPRRALLISAIGGMVILPATVIIVPGLPGTYGRTAAVALPCILGVILTDARAFGRLKLVATDWAMAGLVLAPLASSLSNGLGAYDGASQVYGYLVTFGLPYLLGRLCLRGTEGIKALVIAISIGALLLAPIALWEIRMSPQLHAIIYGRALVPFFMFSRFGGYRPIGFFPSPLMLTFALSFGTLCLFWMARTFRGGQFFGIRYAHWAILLAITTLLGKTYGAITLLIFGGALLWTASRTGRRWILLVAAFVIFLYPPLRITQVLRADVVIAAAEPIFPESKIETLTYRLTQEDLFTAHALKRPWFGWGGWGRNRTAQTQAIDGLWIVLFSSYGYFAVASYLLVFAIPIFRVLRRLPARHLLDPSMGPVAVLSVALLMYWVDCLANAFPNMVFVMSLGAIAGWQPPREPPRGPEPEGDSGESAEAAGPPAASEANARFSDLTRRKLGPPGGGAP